MNTVHPRPILILIKMTLAVHPVARDQNFLQYSLTKLSTNYPRQVTTYSSTNHVTTLIKASNIARQETATVVEKKATLHKTSSTSTVS